MPTTGQMTYPIGSEARRSEASETSIVSTVSSVLSAPRTAGAQTVSSYRVMNVLGDYPVAEQMKILRGLSQTDTVSRGSFAHFSD